MNRREFVTSSSVVVAALAGGAASVRAVSAGIGSSRIAYVLFDRRFAGSREFGAAAGRRNQRVFGFDGDVTAIWAERLDPLWRSGAGTVAGMTTNVTLTCLEQLAALHWGRVVSRLQHLATDPGEPCLVSWQIASRTEWRANHRQAGRQA
jgi:hypothetical protein